MNTGFMVRLAFVAFGVVGAAAVTDTQSEPLRLLGSIPLARVEGRIDHLAADLEGQRLFVAALGSATVEVVDVRSNQAVKSLPGFDDPQGIRYLPETQRIVVANGGNGAVTFVDTTTFTVSSTVKLSGDADNVRYDARARRIYIGYGNGALSVLDLGGKRIGDVRLAAHPESFQLESSSQRVYVNVPSAGHVAVVDRDKQAVIATWPVVQARANYPMALDEAHHRLFLGCRNPARLLVYDTVAGRLVASTEIVGDTDDLFYDAARRRIYVSGGEGFITVVEQTDADHYRSLQKLATAAGARTSLFVPEFGRLFLAVPHRGSQRAEIRVFAVTV
jgi:DNA-binding beta-propeller fold protein YncE